MKKETKNIKKKITMDDLALMVGKGFNEVSEKLATLEKGQEELRKGQEDIKTDLRNRVHIFDHKDLEIRVEKVEEKVGITRRKHGTN